MKKLITILLPLFISLFAFAQTTEWYYEYNGPDDLRDRADRVIVGRDDHIYLLGTSYMTTNRDFIISKFNKDGAEKWFYRYDGSTPLSYDVANQIVYGQDDNLYIAGAGGDTLSSFNFMVLSMDTSGAPNWEYHFYEASGQAYDIVVGSDGNIYASGTVGDDFFVISLTPTGTKRWHYRLTIDPGLNEETAVSLVYGDDGNIYAAGNVWNPEPAGLDGIIVSLTTGGVENWQYFYNSAVDGGDLIVDLIYGDDGHLYAAGTSGSSGPADGDLMALSIYTAGTQRWVRYHDGPGIKPLFGEFCYQMIQGFDGNLYIAARDGGSDIIDYDFVVLSYTPNGDSRWVYRYRGIYNTVDMALAITATQDGNIHVAGIFCGFISEFGMISIHGETGRDLWIFRYLGWSIESDEALCIASDDEGYIYVGGQQYDDNNNYDMVLFKLNPPHNTDGFYEFSEVNYPYHSQGSLKQIIRTDDDYYVSAGYLGNEGSFATLDMYLIKTDINGDVVWKKKYGGSNEERGYGVDQTDDGGFIACGSTWSYGAGVEDFYIVKTDASGNMEWQKYYGGTDEDVAICALQTADGGYFVAGNTESFGMGGSDIWLLLTDSTGDTLWSKLLGSEKPDLVSSLKKTQDNNYVLTGKIGYPYGTGGHRSNVYFAKINDAGDTLWTSNYGFHNRYDFGSDIVCLDDGGFLVAGAYNARCGLLRLNSQGDTLWTKTYSDLHADGFNALTQIDPTTFYALKDTRNVAGYYVEILKFDINGVFLDTLMMCSNKNYPGYTCSPYDIQSIPDAGIMTAGESRIANGAYWNPTLVRKGGVLTPVTGIYEPDFVNIVPQKFLLEQNYPNPFNPTTHIRFQIPKTAVVKLIIYDVLGRKAATLVDERLPSGDYQIQWDASGFSSGVYFYQLRAGSFIQTKKMILIK